MNSIGVPGASAGADSLLPQSGVYFKPTLHLHSTFSLHPCHKHIGTVKASSLGQICVLP